MLKFLDKPCLPENKVAIALVSSEYPEIYDKLNSEFNIKTIKIPKNNCLTDDIATHPDCIFTQLNSELSFVDNNNYDNIVNYLTICRGHKIIKTEQRVASPYPEDVRLNVRVIRDMILCNSKHIDKNLRKYADDLGYRIIHCNQGYAACSTIILNDNALITDDETIHRSAQINAIDSILIKKGSVVLKEQEYGFIGGTCGMIDKNLLAFTGRLDSHTDSDIIKSFLYKYDIDYIELTDNPLTDIGGIIPIMEHDI